MTFDTMNTFRSIDELVKMFEREKVLLKEMFYKRKQLSFRYDYALELTEYKEERIRFLIEYGVLRESGDFLEMEDLYLKFFEEVLQINEEINVSFVQDYLNHLNDNIDYFLKENNEQRKYTYQREVRPIMPTNCIWAFRKKSRISTLFICPMPIRISCTRWYVRIAHIP